MPNHEGDDKENNQTVISTQPAGPGPAMTKSAAASSKSAKSLQDQATPEEPEIYSKGSKPTDPGIYSRNSTAHPESDPEIYTTGDYSQEEMVPFTGHPTIRTYPSVTQTRLGAERKIGNPAANVLARSADVGFIPQYAKRVAEYSNNALAEHGITMADVAQGIKTLQELYDNAPDTASKREAVNRMYEELGEELGAYVRHLVNQQFGQDQTDLGRMWVDRVSKANWYASEHSFGSYGGWRTDQDPAEEILMAIDMMKSVEFFAPLSVQQDGTKFSINHGQTKLVEGEVNKQNQTIKFELSADLKGEDLEKAVNALADMVSSHRQLRDNRVRVTSVHENPEVTVRYLEVLLCQHNMHIDISAIEAQLEQQVANNPALQERLHFVKEFMQVFHPADNNLLLFKAGIFSKPLSQLPDLTQPQYGFTPEQCSTEKGYRTCLEHLFQQRLGIGQALGQSAEAKSTAPAASPSASFQTEPSAKPSVTFKKH